MSVLTDTTDTEGQGNPLGQPTTPEQPVLEQRKLSLWTRMKREKLMYLMLAPGILYFFVFHYVPVLGNIAAWQRFVPYLGFWDSPWVGWANFEQIMRSPQILQSVRNTLVISFVQIVFAFPAPIALALFLNTIMSDGVRRFVQSIVYLPHFIGWVIVVSIWNEILGGTGVLNTVMAQFGLGPVNIIGNPSAFVGLVTAQVIWKEVGWGTIIFLAAMLSIPQDQYESAALDGAGYWRRTWHVTLPGIVGVTILLLILRLGSVLSVGFEQILLQQPAFGAEAAQVLDTYVYFQGIGAGNWGVATAVGLVKGVIGTVLVVGANWAARRFGQEGLF